MRKVIFLGGLPRSGSTLLCNILAQNPRLHVTATSGIINVIVKVQEMWPLISEFQAAPRVECESSKIRVLKGILDAYFGDAPEGSVCIDKSRGWPGFPHLADLLVEDTGPAKFIVPVRDLRDVCASFEKLARKALRAGKSLARTDQLRAFALDHDPLGRIANYTGPDHMIGRPVGYIKSALAQGFRDRMHFVEYEELTARPADVISGLYRFLELEGYAHDFANVKQVTQEDDWVHIFPGLHDIRPEVKPQEPSWQSVYDKSVTESPLWAQVTQDAHFWKK